MLYHPQGLIHQSTDDRAQEKVSFIMTCEMTQTITGLLENGLQYKQDFQLLLKFPLALSTAAISKL